jgi:hypothetical protein
VETAEQAWEIVFVCARCWKIEKQFCFDKSELHIDSFRLQDAESQCKLLLLVTLAARFLLSGLSYPLQQARSRLFHCWCQRSDWRLAKEKMPLCRLTLGALRIVAEASFTSGELPIRTDRPLTSPGRFALSNGG